MAHNLLVLAKKFKLRNNYYNHKLVISSIFMNTINPFTVIDDKSYSLTYPTFLQNSMHWQYLASVCVQNICAVI